MSIRKKQLSQVANNIINGFLKSGVLPSVDNVISGVGAAFYQHQIGTPMTLFVPVIPGSRTNQEYLYSLTTNIASDISNLYSEDVDLVNRIVRDFDYKSSWRQRLAQRMVDISNDLNSTVPAPPYVLQNTISSIRNIDLENTDAFINFQDFSVELPSVSNRTQKIDLSDAQISWTTTSSKSATYGNLSDIKTDAANSSFVLRATDTNQKSSFALTVNLANRQNISRVIFNGHVSAATTISLSIDGETMPSYTLGISKRAAWSFSARMASQLVFTLTKTSPDAISGSNYIFDYGVQSINLYYEEYRNSAVFQTNRISFKDVPLASLILNTQQDTPGNTSINWAYSVSGLNNTFQPIVPGIAKSDLTSSTLIAKRIFPVQSTLALSSVHNVDIPSDVTTSPIDTDMPVLSSSRGSRTPLFNLCRIDNNVLPNNTSVRRGRDSWKVRSYHYQPSVGIQDPAPTLSDLADPRGNNPVIYSRYQPTEYSLSTQYPGVSAAMQSTLRLPAIEYPVQNQGDKVMHIFSACLVVQEGLNNSQLQSLSSIQVTLPAIFANHLGTVYLNGTAVPFITSYTPSQAQQPSSFNVTLNLSLVPGNNYLQIITNNYIALGGAAFEFGTSIFSSLCAPGGLVKWYADDGNMTEVSLYELQFQTSRNDFTRYALADDVVSGQKIVLIRELPTTLYDVSYSFINNQAPTSLVLRATLTGDGSNLSITPKISGFTIINNYGEAHV